MSTTVFDKSGSKHGPDFFRYESAGLQWLAEVDGGPAVVPILSVDDDSITLERLDTATPTAAHATEFGRRLAIMHNAGADAWGAPPPQWAGRCFIGNRPQECTPRPSWGEFYAEQRVRPFAVIAHQMGELSDAGLIVVEKACNRIAAGDLDDDDAPARLHGDLWSGNVMWTAQGAVLIDPAAHGGHRETDLAMLALFGAPHLEAIIDGYQQAHPLRPGWRDRIALHQLHPLATHAAGHGVHYCEALVDAARTVVQSS